MKQIRITKWPRKNRGDEPIDPAQQSFKRPYVKLQEDHQDEQATAPPTIHPHKTSNAQLNDQVPAKPERFAVYGIVDNTVDPALEFHVQTVAYGSQACASLRKLADTSGGRHQLAGVCMINAMAHGEQTMVNTLVSSYKWPFGSQNGIVVFETRVTTRARKQGTCTLCERCPCQVEYEEEDKAEQHQDIQEQERELEGKAEAAGRNKPSAFDW
ncbi:hypothetical protein TWF569_008652 [Orbilia oligospora]|nr:hypothetical protein TWF569_008652 [Orbilia oligospora]